MNAYALLIIIVLVSLNIAVMTFLLGKLAAANFRANKAIFERNQLREALSYATATLETLSLTGIPGTSDAAMVALEKVKQLERNE